MIAQLRVRKDTNANWMSNDPVLTQGEIGMTTNAPFLLKIGDGTAAWTALESFAIPDGGDENEVLGKSSSSDRDLTWLLPAFPAQVTVFDTPAVGTAYAVPEGCTALRIQALGSGGGGGSGRRAASSSSRFGGDGGSAGSYSDLLVEATNLQATLYATVGDFGTGGAAQTSDTTSGNPGDAGGPSFISTSDSSSFTTAAASAICLGAGGQGGAGGGTSSTSPFTPESGGMVTGGAGAISQNGTANQPSQGGGGAGGTLNSSNVVTGTGSRGSTLHRGPYGWVGSGSPSPGANGVAGSASTTRISDVVAPGCGGSGGTPQVSGPGGSGGDGDRGGGGGGGGAAVNGNNSGAGGDGGTGFVIVTAYF